MYSASEWIFLDLWRFINGLLLLIIIDVEICDGLDVITMTVIWSYGCHIKGHNYCFTVIYVVSVQIGVLSELTMQRINVLNR